MLLLTGEMGLALAIYCACVAAVHVSLVWFGLDALRPIGALGVVGVDVLGGGLLFLAVLAGWDRIRNRR